MLLTNVIDQDDQKIGSIRRYFEGFTTDDIRGIPFESIIEDALPEDRIRVRIFLNSLMKEHEGGSSAGDSPTKTNVANDSGFSFVQMHTGDLLLSRGVLNLAGVITSSEIPYCLFDNIAMNDFSDELRRSFSSTELSKCRYLEMSNNGLHDGDLRYINFVVKNLLTCCEIINLRATSFDVCGPALDVMSRAYFSRELRSLLRKKSLNFVCVSGNPIAYLDHSDFSVLLIQIGRKVYFSRNGSSRCVQSLGALFGQTSSMARRVR